ncbi:MAG: hypothetical protein GY832_30835, partial [Chloroflexi bacterium]|nr:hypothetical protein [Chloroflexota bacterium]
GGLRFAAIIVGLMLISALLVYGLIWGIVNLGNWLGRGGDVYAYSDGQWQAVPHVRGELDEMLVSPTGVVWMSTSNVTELHRIDSEGWQSFDKADLGNAAPRDLTLVGEEIWAVTRNGVVHYDGVDWTAHKGILATQNPSSIAANETDVWVLDKWGHLDHFDGTSWTTTDLAPILPDAGWSNTFDSLLTSGHSSELVLTADGSLWLACDGLWRFDGANWTEMQPGNERAGDVDLIMTNDTGTWVWADRLWLWDGTGWRSSAETVAARPGFPSEARVYQMSRQGDYVATDQGVFRIVNDRWEALPLPEGMSVQSRRMAVSNGSVWVVLTRHQTTAKRIALFTAGIALYAAVVTIGRFGLALHARSKNDAPDKVTQKGNILVWQGILYAFLSRFFETLLLLSLTVGIPIGIYRIWKDIPEWLLLCVSIFLYRALPSAGKWLLARLRGQSTPGQPSHWKKLFGNIISILFAVCMTGAMIWVWGWLMATGKPFYLAFLVIVPVTALAFVFISWPKFWVDAAVKRGDYDAALRRFQSVEKVWPSYASPQNFALILMLAGRHAEAEARLRAGAPIISQQQQEVDSIQGFTLTLLSYALLEQGKYREAMLIFEETVRKSIELPSARFLGNPTTYNGLAEVYLRQGIEPRRALELLDRAIAMRGNVSSNNRLSGSIYSSEILANRAWALALQHHCDESKEALAQAFQKASRKHKIEMSSLHYRAGHVMQLCGYKTEAIEHWTCARQLDPQGHYGRLAAQAMRDRGRLQ